jgi:hypothetical protein
LAQRKTYLRYVNGFSLLEVLVAAFLGMLLLEAILQSYLSAKNVYRAQNELTSLSENIRTAEFILWQNIMQAGFAGCRKVSELNLSNHVQVKYTAMGFGIRGYNSFYLPNYLLNKHIVVGTDVIVIGKASSHAVSILKDVKKGAFSLPVAVSSVTKSKHILLISDCKNADLFDTEMAKTFLAHDYQQEKTQVRLFEELAFFIGRHSDRKNHPLPSLYICTNRGYAEELVSDVSDMKIYYGANVNGSYQYLRAPNIVAWDKVLGVIIDLKMHSNKLVKHRRIYVKLRERG